MLVKNNGQTTVEFALVVVLFLTLIFSIMDFALMFFVNQTMQHAVRSGARLAVTGMSNAGSDRLSTMTDKIREQSMGFYEKNTPVRTPVISVQRLGAFYNISGTPVKDTTGASQQLITVRLDYSWPLLTPLVKPFFKDGKYAFTVKSTVVNEPDSR